MSKAIFTSLYSSGPWQTLENQILGDAGSHSLFGLSESQKSYITSGLYNKISNNILLIVSDNVKASRMQKDIEGLVKDVNCQILPSRPVQLGNVRAFSLEDEMARISIIGQLLRGYNGILIAPIDSLITPLPPVKAFLDGTINLSLGMKIDPLNIETSLSYMGYRMEHRVESVGQYARRGDILDIFIIGSDHPLRIEFFDDEIDSLRVFDESNQRSLEHIKSINILPAIETPLTEKSMQRGILHMKEEAKHFDDKHRKKSNTSGFIKKDIDTLTSFVNMQEEKLLQLGAFEGMENFISYFYPTKHTIVDYMKNPLVIFDDPLRIKQTCDALIAEFGYMYEDALKKHAALPKQGELLFTFNDIIHEMGNSIISMQSISTDENIPTDNIIRFQGRDAPIYKGRFHMLKNDMKEWKKQGYNVVFLTGSIERAKRLEEALSDFEMYLPVIETDRELAPKESAILSSFITKGFECNECKIVILSEFELFGTSRSKRRKRATTASTQAIFNDLNDGDYIVHENHGIGQYQGVVNLETGEYTRDYLKIIYMDNDILYVPVEQMDRVQKYVGKDSVKPRLNRIGSKKWAATKTKAKKAVQDMTESLIKLYSKRASAKGFVFEKDTDWERQFAESFPYEETADQVSCIKEIKEDMQSSKVMDRLLCGDVGYGKTEVALRGVFKAIMNKKQAAILCPTTILAHQHYETMLKRFGEFPINSAELSRFLSKAEQDKVIRGLKNGSIDVVVGTHRLLSSDVGFKDLGLLIVDEEQRFGVSHKEKIKQLKDRVDVLTLTATPIPRTLHMSLSGIRDISMLDTPPEERHPVQTFVIEYDEEMVRSAILKEIGRDGKVFFLYNRVASIDIMANKLKNLVSEARIGIIHGQMNEHKLEENMMKFLKGEYNVLLCTTIIESGLDIPEANTLIVYDADKFGLSQLYQIRGRVGRSNRLAYAYLTWRGGKILSEAAEKRLTAISQFTEFGSGLKIAMRDLEIRGAGDILGASQHGHMAAVGYGLYCKIIENAMRKIKGEEVPEDEIDVVLSLQIDASIPNNYILDSQDRLDIYRRMAMIDSPKDKSDVLDELIDRFGEPPQSVANLLDVAYLKSLAQKSSVEMIRQQGDIYTIRFADDVEIDVVKLLELADKYNKSLKLINKDSIMIRFIAEHGGIDELFTLLMEIADCKIYNDLV